MINRKAIAIVAALAATATAIPVVAQDIEGAVSARQSQFRILSMNVGVLGNMARGNSEYDAEAAAAAANNIRAISELNQRFNWPEGSDNAAIEGTRALPAIWENVPDLVSKWQNLNTAAVALDAVAGNGLDEMRAAFGPVGAACGACHDAYRAPQ